MIKPLPGLPRSLIEIVENVAVVFRNFEVVEGIALCGSFANSTEDKISDVDVWIYHRPEISKFELAQLVAASPGEFVAKPAHGSNYAFCEYEHGGRLVSLKFINTEVIDRIQACFGYFFFDEMIFEDIETYLTWHILWERGRSLSTRTELLSRSFSFARPSLQAHAERRYGDLIWRSAFQGLYRSDLFQWKQIFSSVLAAMPCVCALERGAPPAPQKWRFSTRNLEPLGLHPGLKTVWQELEDAVDATGMASTYLKLFALENVAIHWLSPEERWWRTVFDYRSLNITPSSEVATLCGELATALKLDW